MPHKPRFNLIAIPQHVIQRGNNPEHFYYYEVDMSSYMRHLISLIFAFSPATAYAAGIDAVIFVPAILLFVIIMFIAISLSILTRSLGDKRFILIAAVIFIPIIAVGIFMHLDMKFQMWETMAGVLALLAFLPLITYAVFRKLILIFFKEKMSQENNIQQDVITERKFSSENQKKATIVSLLVVFVVFVLIIMVLLKGMALI